MASTPSERTSGRSLVAARHDRRDDLLDARAAIRPRAPCCPIKLGERRAPEDHEPIARGLCEHRITPEHKRDERLDLISHLPVGEDANRLADDVTARIVEEVARYLEVGLARGDLAQRAVRGAPKRKILVIERELDHRALDLFCVTKARAALERCADLEAILTL